MAGPSASLLTLPPTDLHSNGLGVTFMSFDPQRAIELLVCPQSHAPLVYDGHSLVSTDPETRLRYAIRDDIPVMLADEAETVPADEWTELMRRHGRDPSTGRPSASEGVSTATPEEA